VAQRISSGAFFFLKQTQEYIISALSLIDSRRTTGCRTLVFFKGAGFAFSAGRALFACATLCGDFTDAAISISLLSVVIDGVPSLELLARETAF
jgi:hypothetical protein